MVDMGDDGEVAYMIELTHDNLDLRCYSRF